MMRRKWNIILIAVLLLLTSIFLSACEDADEGQDAPISNEQNDSAEDEISDKPIEYPNDYAEDDETMEEESSEGAVDGHEEETVIEGTDDMEVVPEEESEY